MPETKPSDEIIDLTDIIEEDDPQAADSGGTGDAGVDMSFERELEDLFSDAGPSAATGQAAPAPAARKDRRVVLLVPAACIALFSSPVMVDPLQMVRLILAGIHQHKELQKHFFTRLIMQPFRG